MRLTPYGAMRADGAAARAAARAPSISLSQASNSSGVRALRAGKVPATPAWQVAVTRAGPDTRNIGAAMAGTRRVPRKALARVMLSPGFIGIGAARAIYHGLPGAGIDAF